MTSLISIYFTPLVKDNKSFYDKFLFNLFLYVAVNKLYHCLKFSVFRVNLSLIEIFRTT